MEYQDDIERGRKIKILTVATIAALIVLALGAWAIIAAVSSSKYNKDNLQAADPSEDASTTTIVASESERKAAESKEQNSADKSAESKNTASSKADSSTASNNSTATISSTTNTTTGAPANTSGDIPYTGPADTALATLLIGVATYLVALNSKLKKAPREA